jgi:hypothetical protein
MLNFHWLFDPYLDHITIRVVKGESDTQVMASVLSRVLVNALSILKCKSINVK